MADILLLAGRLNNRQDPLKLGKVADSENPKLVTLVDADNVDIENNGAVTLRNGRIKKFSGVPHSFWTHPSDDSIGYFVEDSVLKKLNADFSATTVATLSSNLRLVYEPVNDEIVVSNGVDIGWLSGTEYVPFAQTLKKFEHAIPAGQYLAFTDGSLIVLRGNSLFVSKPQNIMVMDTRYCQFQLAGYGRMLAAVEEGFWVATEHEVGFVSGKGVDDYAYVKKSSYPPPDGAFIVTTEEKEKRVDTIVTWASQEGFCRGFDNGEYENLSVEDCTLPDGPTGRLFNLFNNGIRQNIAVIHQPVYSRKKVTANLITDDLVVL